MFNTTPAISSGYVNYVTDSIEVPLRSNPGYKFKIIRMVKSGSKVTIQEVNDKGWAKLTYRNKGRDFVGWMPTSMLQATPISATLLKKQTEKTSRIEKSLNQLKQEKETLQARLTIATEELNTVKQQNFELEKELQNIKKISGRSLEISEENNQLSQQINQLKSDNIIMKEQLSQASDVVQRQWFLTGGGVLLLGLILGRLFRMPAKKNKWDSL
ncbi:MAG TPA: TIGR04211 family SH3 domain-containing protein [Thiomicrospira sp.]|nr:TIGR04211 family SH3 domain-containing protein [Thiomicrospira sp.]